MTGGFPHEATLVETTLQNRFVTESPEYLTGDRAYDSDPLGKQLGTEEIEPAPTESPETGDTRCAVRIMLSVPLEDRPVMGVALKLPSSCGAA